jgi:hypothetical protein
MDTAHEIARLKGLLTSTVLFLVSGCLSWTEMAYFIMGQDTQASVIKTYEVKRRWGKRQVVDYQFTEPGGTNRRGSDTVSRDWKVPPDGKVPIRYTAGSDGNSRLTGNVNWVGLILFAVSLASIGWFVFRLWREASEATRERYPNPK